MALPLQKSDQLANGSAERERVGRKTSSPQTTVVANDEWADNDNDRYESVDEVFNKSYGKAGLQLQNPGATNDNLKRTRNNDYERELLEETERQLQVADNRERRRVALRRGQLSSANTVASLSATAKATPDTIWMLGVQAGFWSTVQLSLAIASLAFLGVSAGVQSTMIGRAISSVAGAINSVTSIFGFDFSILNPIYLFLVLHTLLFGFMLLNLFSTMFYYAMRHRRPVFGPKGGLKSLTIILVIIGSGMPVANLLPWIMFYVLVMWRYPK